MNALRDIRNVPTPTKPTPISSTCTTISHDPLAILDLLVLARTSLGLQSQTLASVGDDLAVAFRLHYAGIGLQIGLFMGPGVLLALLVDLWGRYVADSNVADSNKVGSGCLQWPLAA